MEVAVVPSPDPLRLNVPKAFVILAAGHSPSPELAQELLGFARGCLSPYKRVRRLQFVSELPKTLSGKIRRIELRLGEAQRRAGGSADLHDYAEEDFAAHPAPATAQESLS